MRRIPGSFISIRVALTPAPDDVTCTATPAGDGGFTQNIQRLGLYAQDSWRVTSHLTVNYGLRWDTTFGLFDARAAASCRTRRFSR